VTTPDPDVLAHVRATWRDEVLAIARDPRLAIPNTYLNDTLRHALGVVEGDDPAEERAFEAVMQLTIESPFRAARHIDAAIEVMELFDTDVVVGVRAETDNLYRHNGSGLVPVRETSGLRLEREDIYREAGSMRLLKRALVMKENSTQPARIGHVVLDAKAAHLLRSEWDLELAAFIADRTAAETLHASIETRSKL
jgi:CMP-N-acetylneuraminic acid synthetase